MFNNTVGTPVLYIWTGKVAKEMRCDLLLVFSRLGLFSPSFLVVLPPIYSSNHSFFLPLLASCSCWAIWRYPSTHPSSSRLFLSFTVGVFRPRLPSRIRFGILLSHIFITCPSHRNMLTRLYFISSVSLYYPYNSLYRVLHTPLSCTDPGIPWRIFSNKETDPFFLHLGHLIKSDTDVSK